MTLFRSSLECSGYCGLDDTCTGYAYDALNGTCRTGNSLVYFGNIAKEQDTYAMAELVVLIPPGAV